MMNRGKPIGFGLLSALLLLGVYFAVLSAVSGFAFAQEQFGSYWYFVVSLAAGFGLQVGLYSFLRQAVKFRGQGVGPAAVAVTGTTSTAAMISCCAHYAVNILPVLGAVGIATFVAQYQTELFWVGLIFNLGGIAYIGSKVLKFRQQHGKVS